MSTITKPEILHLMVHPASPKVNEKITMSNFCMDTLSLTDLVSKVNEHTGETNFKFVFRGIVLKDDVPLKNQGIKRGSVIQVIKSEKKKKSEAKMLTKFTESEVQEVIWMYRSITASNFHKASRPEFLRKVLEKYPQLRNNLTAISILRDPVLLATMGNPDTVRRMAEENRDLIDATKFIVETLTSKSMQLLSFAEEPTDDMDSSSSSDDQNMVLSRTNHRITSTQLAQALGQVFASGPNSSNSLANISQRNLTETPNVEGSSSSSSSNNTTPNRITSSMFLNALSEVLRSTRSNNEVRNLTNPFNENANEESQSNNVENTPRQESSNTSQPPMFLSELQQMREMGLTDTELCLQALMICNGDLENAVNLVLSGGGNN
uniref:CSON015405 protein n=1 Tax=Culicoides sonorensis TaxID=179676 RepID=A0A336M1D8_CULSO